MPGGHSEREPPDPIPNSEVKLLSADDSVGFPHVKVGHCQAFISETPTNFGRGFFFQVSYLNVATCSPIGFLIAVRQGLLARH